MSVRLPRADCRQAAGCAPFHPAPGGTLGARCRALLERPEQAADADHPSGNLMLEVRMIPMDYVGRGGKEHQGLRRAPTILKEVRECHSAYRRVAVPGRCHRDASEFDGQEVDREEVRLESRRAGAESRTVED